MDWPALPLPLVAPTYLLGGAALGLGCLWLGKWAVRRVLPGAGPWERAFWGGFATVVVLTALVAVALSGGRTVWWVPPLLLGLALWRLRVATLAHEYETPAKAPSPGLWAVLVLVPTLAIYGLTWRAGYAFVPAHPDHGLYTHMAAALARTGHEGWVSGDAVLAPGAYPRTPYHHLELWLAAGGTAGGLSPLALYCLTVPALLLVLVGAGVLALAERFAPRLPWGVLAGLLVLFWLWRPLTNALWSGVLATSSTVSQLAGPKVLLHPKHYPGYLLYTAALLALHQRAYAALGVLGALAVAVFVGYGVLVVALVGVTLVWGTKQDWPWVLGALSLAGAALFLAYGIPVGTEGALQLPRGTPLQELKAILHASVVAVGVWAPQLAFLVWLYWRRHPTSVSLWPRQVVLLVALVVGGGCTLWQLLEARGAPEAWQAYAYSGVPLLHLATFGAALYRIGPYLAGGGGARQWQRWAVGLGLVAVLLVLMPLPKPERGAEPTAEFLAAVAQIHPQSRVGALFSDPTRARHDYYGLNFYFGTNPAQKQAVTEHLLKLYPRFALTTSVNEVGVNWQGLPPVVRALRQRSLFARFYDAQPWPTLETAQLAYLVHHRLDWAVVLPGAAVPQVLASALRQRVVCPETKLEFWWLDLATLRRMVGDDNPTARQLP